MLPTYYQEFIHKSRYARWDDTLKRRETWEETVARYLNFFEEHLKENHGFQIPTQEKLEMFNAIETLETMPSMRCLMTAGRALARDHASGYNCSFINIDSPRAFDETMFILMCGTGVGFSVERQFVNQLPVVPESLEESQTVILVRDSKRGWAAAYKELIALLYAGQIPKWDVSKVRLAGERLKTMGGRASGPAPLIELFEFTIHTFMNARGRRLTSLECHDLMCKIGEGVVVGGVRRSAMLSLSNLSDQRMRDAKSGAWWEHNKQRALANNSVCYTETPEVGQFMAEWLALYQSKSGERGIFNREAARRQAMSSGRRKGFWDEDCKESIPLGTNPCSEILLRSHEFCNLTEAVARPNDTESDLERKVRTAAILGTWQSTLTNFRYLTKKWSQNCEEERLLGVSITGIMDSPHLQDPRPELLHHLKECVNEENRKWTEILGIPVSAATTCVKPSGCRPSDALTCTDQGIYTLTELMRNHHDGQDWADVKNINSADYGAVTKTFINGISKIIRIKTGYGFILESTPNHEWFVKDKGWVRSDNLIRGDVIETSIGNYNSRTNVSLTGVSAWAYAVRVDSKKIKVPKNMSPDLAWLLGYLWGDGSQSEHKYKHRWIDANRDHLEKLKRIMYELFGMESSIERCKDRNAYHMTYASRALWDFMQRNKFMKYGDYETGLNDIPLAVRSSSKECILAFISGWLDSDGCVSKTQQGYKVTFTSADERFVRHVQHVGLCVGLVIGASVNGRRRRAFSRRPIYLCSLSVETCVESFNILTNHSCKAENVKNWVYHKPRKRKPGRYPGLGEVVSVGEEYIAPTFDIETESHWFWAGSFKSHNTVSQLVMAPSGIHAWHDRQYIRRVSQDNKDPMTEFMKEVGFPHEPHITEPDHITVFSFPVKAPEGSLTRDDLPAIKHLEIWKKFQDHWCEHKPSITVTVKEDEWPEVGAWVWKNFDSMSGVAFLPHDGGSYRQAPYETVSLEKIEELESQMPDSVDWEGLRNFEDDDQTRHAKELACSAGVCDL